MSQSTQSAVALALSPSLSLSRSPLHCISCAHLAVEIGIYFGLLNENRKIEEMLERKTSQWFTILGSFCDLKCLLVTRDRKKEEQEEREGKRKKVGNTE